MFHEVGHAESTHLIQIQILPRLSQENVAAAKSSSTLPSPTIRRTCTESGARRQLTIANEQLGSYESFVVTIDSICDVDGHYRSFLGQVDS